MKTLIKPLLVAFSLILISLTVSLAAGNPGRRPARIATFQSGVYITAEGKVKVALDKQTGGAVTLRLMTAAGQELFAQQVGKNQTMTRMQLDVSNLPDGAYQLVVSNGVDTTTHELTLATKQPVASPRRVVLN
ncbi:hypothetical protein [Spirosoma sp. 209]|uniref:hypothetical protein n=1 Tax=Spirosoma sp. 209 TaxID=1955701 RepID=UPI00098D72CF|nr:hypothetical protein [Spirosoma sp. 209]